MSAPPYMKLYVADYLGDTHHLSALEHGGYLLLLMAMWRAGGSLPAADANLAKLARCTADQWAEIKAVVLPFFRVSRGRLTHKRLGEELAKYENTSGKRSEAGKRGAFQKHNKNRDNTLAIATTNDKQLPPYPEPEPERIPTTIYAPEWPEMLAQAKEAMGDAGDFTRPAMHHAADLRALVEPRTGEPCAWGEVLDAIRMVAMRQKAKGKLVASWSWVKDDALALRDKRLNAANPAVADVVQLRQTGPPSSFIDRIAAENAEARRRVLSDGK